MTTGHDLMEARAEELDTRLQGYHGQGLADVLELLDYLREAGDTVIGGGSLSIGQGNRLSDLDVVLVGPTTNSSAVPLEHWIGSLRVDGWVRATADVTALFEQAEAALASGAPLAGAFGTTAQEQQLKLLHRIAFGVVIGGEPLPASFTASGRPTAEVARELLTREYAERARESIVIAELAQAAGSELTAASVARMGAEEALHAALHGRGAPFSGDKWLAEQVAGYPDLAAAHATVANLPAAGQPLAPYTAAAIALASGQVGIDLSVQAAAPHLRWSHEELTLLPIGPRRLLVSELHGTGWELDQAEADRWTALLAATPEGETTFPHPAGDAAAEALLIGMYEVGMVAPVWTAGLPLADLAIATDGSAA